MDRNLLLLLLLGATTLSVGTESASNALSRIGLWKPLPPLPVVGTGSVIPGVAQTCPVCTEAACCSFMCPNGYLCTATGGKAPECLFAPPGANATFVGSQACKRVNCDSCTSTQISCSALTRLCISTATENVCQFNY